MVTNNEVTPYGIWRYGNDYRMASVYVLIQYPDQPFVPYLSLLGQSIELLLKAFLMAQGVTLIELKKNFGHDIKALVAEARKHGIESKVTLTNAHWATIELMSDEYKYKRYHYIKVGQMLVPDLQLGHEAAERLCKCLESICKGSG